MKIEGWLGGVYSDLGMFNSKEAADKGIMPNDTLCELLEDYKGKRVIITIKDLDKEKELVNKIVNL